MALSLISKVTVDGIEANCLSEAKINSIVNGCDDAELIFTKDLGFEPGMEVDLYLGYKKYGLKGEFFGFITEISSENPYTVKCYDHSLKLGKDPYSKNFSSESLAKVVKQTAKGFYVETDTSAVKKIISKVADGVTRRSFLNKLAADFVYINFFSDGKLYFVKPDYFEDLKDSAYEEGKNIVENNLKTSKKGITGDLFVIGYPWIRAGLYFSVTSEKVSGVFQAGKVETSFGSDGFRRRIYPKNMSAK